MSTETLQSILLPDYIRLTWAFFVLYDCFLLDANVMQSTDHGKSRKENDLQTFQDTVMKWRFAAFRHSHSFATPIQSVLCWFLCTFSDILQIRHKSKAGTGLSNHGFFFYFTRSWGTCKVSRILVNRNPSINTSARLRLTWPFFVLYDCFLLDANVMRSTDHGKSRKVNDLQTFQDTVMKWRLAAFRHSHSFATPIQSVLCWFLCTFSDILQIWHKSKAGTGLSNHGFFFYSTRSWGTCKVSRIIVNRNPPINTSSGLYKTHLAVLCAIWLFSTWRKCEAVNRSWQIKKRKRPSNFSRYCNEMTS